MTFWDGTRWLEDDPATATPAPTHPRRRVRDWLSTGVMILALVALVVPIVGASAVSLGSGRKLATTWSRVATVRTVSEQARIQYSGTWHRVARAGAIGGQVRFATRRRQGHDDVHRLGDLVDRPDRPHPREGEGLHRRPADQDRQHVFRDHEAGSGPLQADLEAREPAPDHDQGRRHPGHPGVAIDAFLVRTSTALTSQTTTQRVERAVRHAEGPAHERQGSGRLATTLKLTGFTPASTGHVEFDGSPDGLPTYTTNSGGNASVTITIPGKLRPAATRSVSGHPAVTPP